MSMQSSNLLIYIIRLSAGIAFLLVVTSIGASRALGLVGQRPQERLYLHGTTL